MKFTEVLEALTEAKAKNSAEFNKVAEMIYSYMLSGRIGSGVYDKRVKQIQAVKEDPAALEKLYNKWKKPADA